MVSKRKLAAAMGLFACLVALALAGCGTSNDVVQGTSASAANTNVSTMLQITDPAEKEGVELAMAKVRGLGRTPRVIATSPATVDICDKLGIELVGICSSELYDPPERYKDLPKVGTAMSPDMEKVSSLSPDWILSPSSLESDLKPKYEAIGADYAFLNLKSVQGMYRSIQELGEIFDCRAEAEALTEEFTQFYQTFQAANADNPHPKVLILMGLPGSYVIATPNSYVGSLVELAGGENVYAGEKDDFLTVNTEDMKSKEPDIILRTAHALPDQVQEMFAKDFEENDIWRHFEAVQNGKVYDLPYDTFGMSATFAYQDALKVLQEKLYGKTKEVEKA